MLERTHYSSLGLAPIYDKIMAGHRLSAEDGHALFACPDITAVGSLAHHVRTRLHGNKTYYVVNRHINYTNVCVNGCVFCAFRRDAPNQAGAFVLSKEDIVTRVCEAMGMRSRFTASLDELHIVGGCHPTLPLAWFEDVLQSVIRFCPDIMIKAFTAVEIAHFAALEKISTLDVLTRLKHAGLVMMPGGGAEIFDADIRQRLCPHKADAATWLRIAGEAHGLGIRTNATMLYGHIENHTHRIDHLCRLRVQQDASGGFTCFIPLPFQTENSLLQLPSHVCAVARGLDQLRTVAVSRLMLDNIPHIKAYWVMMGTKLAQMALWYGANDMDGTIVEEHIGHMAGAQSTQALTIVELEAMITDSGFSPTRRNALFGEVPLP